MGYPQGVGDVSVTGRVGDEPAEECVDGVEQVPAITWRGRRGRRALPVGGREVLEPVPGGQVVVGVLAFSRFPDGDGLGDGPQVTGDGLGVLAAGLVGVGDDDDVGPGEVPVVLVPPFARAAGAGGGDGTGALQGMNVLLALWYINGLPVRDGPDDLRQPVRDAADSGQVPPPPGLRRRVGMPLRELLAGSAQYLEQQGASLIGVVIDGDSGAARRPFIRLAPLLTRCADVGKG